jgi:hypothetical protein
LILIGFIAVHWLRLRSASNSKTLAERSRSLLKGFSSKNWLFILLSFLFCLIVTLKYLDFKLEPKYSVADPAIHYLYMKGTVETGVLPAFREAEVFKASGENPVFEFHHSTHFPGSLVAFFILAKILSAFSHLELLQIFNILFYFLSLTYFGLILKKYFKSRFLFSLFYLTAALGGFFSLFIASYTNQYFGLFLLLFFLDINRSKDNYLLKIVALAALIISYVYYLPVALLAIFAKEYPKLKNKKIFLDYLIIFIATSLLCLTYGLVALNSELFSHSTETATVQQPLYLVDIILIALLFYLTLKLFSQTKKIKLIKINPFPIRQLVLPFLTYAFFLMVALYLGKTAVYPFTKITYTIMPLVSFFIFVFIDNYLNWETKPKKEQLISKEQLNKKKPYFFLILLIMIFWPVLEINFMESKGRTHLYFNRNMDAILGGFRVTSGLTKDQELFLQKLKQEHSEALNNDRILIIGSPKRLWFSFAKSKIWPRTFEVMPQNKENVGTFSPMSPFSRLNFDYGTWLKNSKEHYLVLLDDENTQNWLASEKYFDINDYDEIFSVGANRLLKLKDGLTVDYSYRDDSWNKYEEYEVRNYVFSQPVLEKFERTFKAQNDNLKGVAFLLSSQGRTMQGEYVFEIYRDFCVSEKDLILKKEFTNQEVLDNQYNEFLFDKIEDSKGENFCYQFYPKQSTANKTPLQVFINLDNEIDKKEIYEYNN